MEMRREQSERENEKEAVGEEQKEREMGRGKWQRNIEKGPKGGLCFVYLLYRKRLFNLAPLTPPWLGITCNNNAISLEK